MRVLIMDGQGGGLGKQLVAALKDEPDLSITAVGTNSAATNAMLKAGAHEGATGENAAIVATRRADVIMGPVGIAIADSLLGEITPAVATAVGQSPAKKILIPMNMCDIMIPGLKNVPIKNLINDAVEQLLILRDEKA
ncbi:MAG: DUF3842 family protein [Lachnospiraceae bacterium]|nr:DUF3842 family protein [Lachnospiraceae bacterium]